MKNEAKRETNVPVTHNQGNQLNERMKEQKGEEKAGSRDCQMYKPDSSGRAGYRKVIGSGTSVRRVALRYA